MQDRSGRSKTFRTGIIGSTLFAFLTLQGCLTYSSFQSARIVERGLPHATLGISRSIILEEEDIAANWWTFDGDMRFGIAKRVDGSIRVSVFHNVPEGWGGGQVSVDIRGGIIEDYLAIAFPFSVNMGDFHFYTLRFQPGFVGTIPLNERIEITGAARAHVYLRIMELTAVAYNVGLGITTRSGEWTIRPEVGWLQFTAAGSDVTYFQYGVGIEHNFVVERGNMEGEKDDRVLDSLIDH
jgi:hypothetical protein